MDCRFCDIIAQDSERIIRRTKGSIVILSNPRLMPGHVLVVPKRHVERFSELSDEERKDLFDETIWLQEKILQTIAPGCDVCEHFRPFIPENSLKVNHLHVHLRPRKLDDELYEKVQIYERDVFRAPDGEELKKYKKLFSA
jgi:histidine triad (HIT) family protein